MVKKKRRMPICYLRKIYFIPMVLQEEYVALFILLIYDLAFGRFCKITFVNFILVNIIDLKVLITKK